MGNWVWEFVPGAVGERGLAIRRRSERPKPRVPNAAKHYVFREVVVEGDFHCLAIEVHAAETARKRIGRSSYPHACLHHGARPAHQLTSAGERVVAHKLGGGSAPGLMPRVASGSSAVGVGVGDLRGYAEISISVFGHG